MHSIGWVPLVGGLLVAASTISASAADLGGDCCADLEERIAELEATTARKGNRKVSLTISGWVTQQLQWWDDGVESNAYLTDLSSDINSHVKFSGQTQISPGFNAGYVLQIISSTAEPVLVNQDNDNALFNGSVSALQTYWFLSSDSLGKISLGKLSPASDNATILIDGSGSLLPSNFVLFEGSSFFLNNDGVRTSFTWGSLANCHHSNLGIGGDCNGLPSNAVRYDSPTFSGFSVSATWGEDDFWDVAARYSGEFQSFKLAAAVAYSENTDENLFVPVPHRDASYFQVGAYLQHVPTGLFAYGAYGTEATDHLTPGGNPIADDHHWYVKAGIRQKWVPLGHTVLWGEYARYSDMTGDSLIDAGATSSELDRWGLGVVQEIDAAAMSLWLKYRNLSGEVDGVAGLNDIDDFNTVVGGALINF
ncbi:porin [Hyphomicrobium sp.]|uniref:porin n=1 Tax=Hyphomicrobium sp. TaxID=82 RepID=UPI002FE1D469